MAPLDTGSKAIMDIAVAFQRSRVLLTAFELDLFTVLNEESRTASEVAQALETDPRATDRLMNALVALGLLEKREGRFRNTPSAAAHLVKGKPAYMGGLGHTNHLWHTWGNLTDAVREGVAPGLDAINDRGARWLKPFIAAMHYRARQQAPELVGMLDLDGVHRVLDVGGGSGAFSFGFARAGRGINAVIYDLPNVVPMTRAYIQEEGLSASVETATGNYLRDPLPTGFQMVFMSAVIHSNSPEENQLLFRKAAGALDPGGQLVVSDYIMSEDRTQPAMGAFFSLNMLVGTQSGDTFTESEVRGWMADAGFRHVLRKDTSFGPSLLVGRL